MIVIDASAAVELLLWTERGQRVAEHIADPAATVHAPHLLAIEVAQVIRRLEHAGEVSARRAVGALEDLAALVVNRYEHELLLPRIWQLRKNVSGYDAAYVALAELLEAPLLTFDEKLANTPGNGATFLIP